ncbi:hypothetical protein [Labrenzia sp. PHM005]|nr:hypothetical protein [Labrenzia sp. PHM005]
MSSIIQIDDLILQAGTSYPRMFEIAIANGLVVWPKPNQNRPEKADAS